MAITDHINLTGANPLAGPNDDALGPRFPSLRDAYDPDLRATLHDTARDLGTPLADGVYLAVSGPSFETPAEIRAFRTLGADAVGMSTVPRDDRRPPRRPARRRDLDDHEPRRGPVGRAAQPRADAARRPGGGRRAGRPPDRVRGTAAMSADDLRRALAVVDLTRLERPDDAGAIDALAAKAVTGAGRVAAICVYPRVDRAGPRPRRPRRRGRELPGRRGRPGPRRARGARGRRGRCGRDRRRRPLAGVPRGRRDRDRAHRRRHARRDRRRRRPQGDPRDRLARRHGRGPARRRAGPRRRRGLPEDLDRQGRAGRVARGDPRAPRGRARRRPRRASRPPAASAPRSRRPGTSPLPTRSWARAGRPRSASASARARSSTTSSPGSTRHDRRRGPPPGAHPPQARRRRARGPRDRVARPRHHRRLGERRAGRGVRDGGRAEGHDARRARRPDRRDDALGRGPRLVGGRAARPRARQALDRRRRRQGLAAARADDRRVRRRGADDLRPRPRPHRRDARQARVDPGLPHDPGPRAPARRGPRTRAARSSARRATSPRPTAGCTRSATPPPRSSRCR